MHVSADEGNESFMIIYQLYIFRMYYEFLSLAVNKWATDYDYKKT